MIFRYFVAHNFGRVTQAFTVKSTSFVVVVRSLLLLKAVSLLCSRISRGLANSSVIITGAYITFFA